MYRKIYVGEMICDKEGRTTKFTEQVNGEIDKVTLTYQKETNPNMRIEMYTWEDELFLSQIGSKTQTITPRKPVNPEGIYDQKAIIGERYTTTDMIKIEVFDGTEGDKVIIEIVVKE